jgi:hypothetical protein
MIPLEPTSSESFGRPRTIFREVIIDVDHDEDD